MTPSFRNYGFDPVCREGETPAKRDRRLHLDAAEQIVEQARKTGLTAAAKAEVEQHLADAERLTGYDDLADEIDRMRAGVGGKSAGASGPVAFRSADLAQFKAAAASGQPASLKATSTLATGAIAPSYDSSGAIAIAAEKFRVRSLFNTQSMDSPVIYYRRLVTGAAQAAAVAEGALKPEASIVAEQVAAEARKLAVWLPVTDEALDDGGQSFVNELVADLVRDLVGAENRALLSGNGTAPNLRGLLQTTGVQTRTKGTDSVLDSLLKAATQLRTVAFTEPTAVVMHPSDFERIRLSKDSGGSYLLGDPLGQGQPTLVGAPIRLTTDLTVGTAVVADWNTLGTCYIRSDVSVEFSVSHSDHFVRNVHAVRAESRLALAIKRPASAVVVTGLAA
jgi:HK97 family phage major capsid protein